MVYGPGQVKWEIVPIPTYLPVVGMKDTKLIHRLKKTPKKQTKIYFGLKTLNFKSNILNFLITYMNGWGKIHWSINDKQLVI